MEKSYQVTCNQCGAERKIAIRNEKIDWLEDGKPHKIVSGRKRLDSQWGFQCLCGANDILTDQERRTMTNPAEPQPEELTTIIKNLELQEPMFTMVAS